MFLKSDKFVEGWNNLRDKFPPDNFVELGTIVSGREDGVTHYVLSAQQDFKDLVEGGNRSKAESDAWRKFRSERGETEMVTCSKKWIIIMKNKFLISIFLEVYFLKNMSGQYTILK